MSVDRNRVCPPTVIKWLNSPIRKLIQSPNKILHPFVKIGDTAVDIGCGGGFFSAGLAELVGENGRVISVDMQPEMLQFTRQYVEQRGLLNRVTLHQCAQDSLKLESKIANFVLAFYVVHEIPDRTAFFKQVRDVLTPSGKFLVIEPNGHVKANEFAAMIEDARQTGFAVQQAVKVVFSRGVLFQ